MRLRFQMQSPGLPNRATLIAQKVDGAGATFGRSNYVPGTAKSSSSANVPEASRSLIAGADTSGGALPLCRGAKLSVARGSGNSLLMNLRHAAALALVGWYLMVPPSKRNDAPLSEWTVSLSYASAEACQSAQNKNRDQAAAKLKTYDNMTDKQRRDLQHNQASLDQEMADSDSFEAAFQSACIATDDPRLMEK